MYKPDYEPILSAGRHVMSADAFHKRFVVGLGGAARQSIWGQFQELVITPIIQLDICCELWIAARELETDDDPKRFAERVGSCKA